MATAAVVRDRKARGNWQPPCVRTIAHAGRRSEQSRNGQPLTLPEIAPAARFGSQPQGSRLDASDRWLRLLDFTRFPRRHSEDKQAIALPMRRAPEHVRAKAEFYEPRLSRSGERQRCVQIGSHRARRRAETARLCGLAEASSLRSSRLCFSDAPAVPRVAARRDRRRFRSSPPQLSRAALSEAKTLKDVVPSLDSCPPLDGCHCAHEQMMSRAESVRAVLRACGCGYAPWMARSARTHHASALKRLEAIDDRAQIQSLLAARGIPAETRSRAARIEEEAKQFRKRTSASRRPARAANRESSARAAHQPPIRSTHREFPETPCASSTQGSNATAQRIQATSANRLPSNRAAAGWRP
jgi:hypothetical protein